LDQEWCEVVLPYEFTPDFEAGESRELLDQDGEPLEEAVLLKKAYNKKYRTWVLHFRASSANATKAIGLRAQRREATASRPASEGARSIAPDDAILCRCERVSLGEVVSFIRENEARDVNQLKAIRAGMGSCGSKTCAPLYAAAFRAAGVEPADFAEGRLRPLEMELPLGVLAERGAAPERGGEPS
jgi:sarcosine oxidase, subunit alpha